MSEIMIFWLIVIILSVGVEVASLGLTSIWFAGGALVALIAAAFGVPLVIQILLFFVVSLVLLFFTRPIAVKYFNKERIKTNVESLVGKQAIVTGEIDNLQGIGQVVVNGQEWSARSVDERIKLPVGCVVNIMAISGVKLMVEENVEVNGERKAVEQPAVSVDPEDE